MTPAPSSQAILQQILKRLPEARKASEKNEWGTYYNADVQFLLGRLQAVEAHLSIPRACPECSKLLPLLTPPAA